MYGIERNTKFQYLKVLLFLKFQIFSNKGSLHSNFFFLLKADGQLDMVADFVYTDLFIVGVAAALKKKN